MIFVFCFVFFRKRNCFKQALQLDMCKYSGFWWSTWGKALFVFINIVFSFCFPLFPCHFLRFSILLLKIYPLGPLTKSGSLPDDPEACYKGHLSVKHPIRQNWRLWTHCTYLLLCYDWGTVLDDSTECNISLRGCK